MATVGKMQEAWASASTPDEDRDFGPELLDMGLKSPRLTPEEARQFQKVWDEAMKKSVRILPDHILQDTPSLTDLKAALVGLREVNRGLTPIAAVDAVLREAERAGLLTEEREMGALEVAREALVNVQGIIQNAGHGGADRLAALIETNRVVTDALAALRQGRGE